MKNITLFLILILQCANQTFSQSSFKSTPEKENIDKKFDVAKFLGKKDGLYYFIRRGRKIINHIDRYDASGNLKGTFEFSIEPDKATMAGFTLWDAYLIDGKIMAFYCKAESAGGMSINKSVTFQSYDANSGAKIGPQKDIMYFGPWSYTDIGNHFVSISPNEKMFAIASPSQSDKVKFKIYDWSLNELQDGTMSIAKGVAGGSRLNQLLLKDDKTLVMNITVVNKDEKDPFKRATQLIQEYNNGALTTVDPDFGDLFALQYHLTLVDGEIYGGALLSNNESLYRNKMVGFNELDINEVMTQAIGSFKLGSKPNIKEVDKDILLNANWRSTKKKRLEEGIPFMILKDVEVTKDKGIYVVSAVQSYSKRKDLDFASQGGSGYFATGTIYVNYSSADGGTQWMKSIINDQRSGETYSGYYPGLAGKLTNYLKQFECDACKYFGTTSFLKGNELKLIYNDSPNNDKVMTTHEKSDYYDGSNYALTRMITFNKEGNMKPEALYNAKDKKYTTVPSPEYYDLIEAGGEYVLFANMKYNWRFITIPVK